MKGKAWLFLGLLVVPLILLAVVRLPAGWVRTDPDLSYTEFMTAVRSGRVEDVVVSERVLRGTMKDGGGFMTTLPPQAPELSAALEAAHVQQRYALTGTSNWYMYLPLILGAVGLVVMLSYMRRGQPGGQQQTMGAGATKVKFIEPGEATVRFADVAGIEEVKQDLQELVDFLKNPDKYRQMGARIPKGVLLYGPPGTGKTLLARAVAGEAGVPFINFSASEFVEMFVGVGAARVRELFGQARRRAPCIIFIDEIDAVGRHRMLAAGSGHEEREQTLNQLLVEMDGFGAYEGIIVIAATNRVDILDQALLRPGRFDRQVAVDLPDVAGRRQILGVHVRGKQVDEGVDLEAIAKRTAGFTGADLANVVNEAALLAVRRAKKALGNSELDDAVERVVAGGPEKKNRVISVEEKRRVAVHEAGHALVARMLPGSDPVAKVTVIPRGRAGGYTLTVPDEDRRLWTRARMETSLAMLLGGRAAEALVLGDISSGAQNDLERATQIARQMVTRFGMSEAIGPVALLDEQYGGRTASEELAAAVDREVRRLLTSAGERAEQVLSASRAALERIAGALVERETIDAKDLDHLIEFPDSGLGLAAAAAH